MAEKQVRYYPSLEELISFSKEKIFLEPIDQYFEEESNNEESYQEGEVDLKKLDDELSKCLLLDNNDEISTSMESEEINNNANKIQPKIKIIKLSDYFDLRPETIAKSRNDTINKYYWIIQNKNQRDQC